ncbi:HdaA/DnaA family protein [Curvivirga sp.]|uniref:HdaA/DnaA family protein n=1 Tax=Curvivirga sp. TaxID=2856848 RepID=UPI003B5A74F5
MTASRQIPIEFPVRTALGVDDFMVAECNEESIAWLDKWPDWPMPALCLYGPGGSGKTHLLHIWCETSKADNIDGRELTTDIVPVLLENGNGLAVDNAENCPEDSLFHLYNLAKETNQKLLLASKQAPAHWNIELKDLASRLRACPSVGLRYPDEDMLAALMMKQFQDRNLTLSPEILTYVLPRMERSFEAVRKFVTLMDLESLAERRKLTVPFAARIMDRMEEQQ